MGCLSIDEPYHEARCVRVSKQKNVVLGYAYFYQKYRRSVSIGSYAESSCVHLILARLHLSHACFKMTRSDVHSIPKRTHLRHGLCPSQRVFIFRHAAQARTFISLFFFGQKTKTNNPPPPIRTLLRVEATRHERKTIRKCRSSSAALPLGHHPKLMYNRLVKTSSHVPRNNQATCLDCSFVVPKDRFVLLLVSFVTNVECI